MFILKDELLSLDTDSYLVLWLLFSEYYMVTPYTVIIFVCSCRYHPFSPSYLVCATVCEGQRSRSGIFFNYSLTYFLRPSLSLNPEGSDLAWPTDHTPKPACVFPLHHALHVSAGELSWGSHPCETNTLLLSRLPFLQNYFFSGGRELHRRPLGKSYPFLWNCRKRPTWTGYYEL